MDTRFLKIFSFVLSVSLAACTSEPKRDSTTADNDSMATPSTGPKLLVVPWRAEINDTTQMMEIRRDPDANVQNLTSQDIVDALNNKYPSIRLERPRQSNDTLYVYINDPSYLTQRSGSLGAQAYLAEATYSLTEVSDIKIVTFSFPEGDHAAPGSYGREDFRGQ